MSSRVRMIGQHPQYGVVYGAAVKRYIEESWMKKYFAPVESLAPVHYASWPRWKRLLWMAKFEGFWQVKMFREPRHTDIHKSLYGKTMVSYGIGWPQLKKKKNKYAAKPKQVNGNVKPAFIRPKPLVDPIPVPIDAVRVAYGVYGWAGGGALAQAAPVQNVQEMANLRAAQREYHEAFQNPYAQNWAFQNVQHVPVNAPPVINNGHVVPDPAWAVDEEPFFEDLEP